MNRWTDIFLFAALSIGGDLLAQNCGNLNGTVLDPSGAAVVGAEVHLQAATPQTTTTGAHGTFVLHCVGNDPYQITVDSNGFAESQVSGRSSPSIYPAWALRLLFTGSRGLKPGKPPAPAPK